MTGIAKLRDSNSFLYSCLEILFQSSQTHTIRLMGRNRVSPTFHYVHTFFCLKICTLRRMDSYPQFKEFVDSLTEDRKEWRIAGDWEKDQVGRISRVELIETFVR